MQRRSLESTTFRWWGLLKVGLCGLSWGEGPVREERAKTVVIASQFHPNEGREDRSVPSVSPLITRQDRQIWISLQQEAADGPS
jgi:hypothetical protein